MTPFNALSAADILSETPLAGSAVSVTVSGSSMSPLLRPGDLIAVKKVERHELQPGHIITYRDLADDGNLVTHRVLACRQIDSVNVVFAAGDRLLRLDKPLLATEVLGRVVERRRDGRLLHLDKGMGAWLSRQCAASSLREKGRVSAMNMESLFLTAEGVATYNRRVAERLQTEPARSYRRAGRAWRKLMEGLVSRLTNDAEMAR